MSPPACSDDVEEIHFVHKISSENLDPRKGQFRITHTITAEKSISNLLARSCKIIHTVSTAESGNESSHSSLESKELKIEHVFTYDGLLESPRKSDRPDRNGSGDSTAIIQCKQEPEEAFEVHPESPMVNLESDVFDWQNLELVGKTDSHLNDSVGTMDKNQWPCDSGVTTTLPTEKLESSHSDSFRSSVDQVEENHVNSMQIKPKIKDASTEYSKTNSRNCQPCVQKATQFGMPLTNLFSNIEQEGTSTFCAPEDLGSFQVAATTSASVSISSLSRVLKTGDPPGPVCVKEESSSLPPSCSFSCASKDNFATTKETAFHDVGIESHNTEVLPGANQARVPQASYSSRLLEVLNRNNLDYNPEYVRQGSDMEDQPLFSHGLLTNHFPDQVPFIQSSMRRHECECGVLLNGIEEFKTHLCLVTRTRRFSCLICWKRFGLLDHLKQHMKIHSGHRPHVCNVCGKAFRQSGHLTRHAVIHSGEKPYACAVCGKGFNVAGNCQRHMRTHTQRISEAMRQPFECSLCSMQFNSSVERWQHMINHS